MRIWPAIVFLALTTSARAADNFFVCKIENIYEFKGNATLVRAPDQKAVPEEIDGTFLVNKRTGAIDGKFRYADVKWTVTAQGSAGNSWTFTASDARLPLRYTLNIQTWIAGNPFILTDVGLGDSDTGFCR